MARALSRIQSKFILGLNDHPDTRKAFKSFKIKSVEIKYSVAVKKRRKGNELIITNY